MPAPESTVAARGLAVRRTRYTDATTDDVVLEFAEIANELIVEPSSAGKSNPVAFHGALATAGTTIVNTFRTGTVLVRFPFDDGETSLDAKRVQLLANPYVGKVFKNRLMGAPLAIGPTEPQVTPSDPWFSDLWAFDNTGQSGGTTDADIDAPEGWSIRRNAVRQDGSVVSIAIIDTGIDFEHPDLANNLWSGNVVAGVEHHGVNIYDPTTPPDDTDPNLWVQTGENGEGTYMGGRHGTAVAAVAAAEGGNSSLTTGTAWRADLVSVKVFGWYSQLVYDPQNQTITITNYYNAPVASVIAGINWCAENGVDVVNLSLGAIADSGDQTELSTYDQTLQNAIDAGCLVVISAGNSGRNMNTSATVSIPAASGARIDELVMVGASDRNDARWGFSDFGDEIVDIFAPGVGIKTLLRTGDNREQNPIMINGSPAYVDLVANGTSLAAPIVAGVAALLRAEYPDETVAQIHHRLTQGLDKPGSLVSEMISGQSTPLVAFDGRINLKKTFSPWIHYPDLDPDWADISVWFGWLRDGEYPWIAHLNHGWLYQEGITEDDLWFYDQALDDWWWTSRSHYQTGSGNGRWAWFPNLNQWFHYCCGTTPNRWWQDEFGNWFSDADLKAL